MLNRRTWILLVSAGAGCRRTEPPLEASLPAEVDSWSLEQAASLRPVDAPEFLRGKGVRRAVRAVYRGQARLALSLYEMSGQAAAFELLQKWRPTPSRTAFYHDRFFGVAESSVDQQALARFVEAFERQWKP